MNVDSQTISLVLEYMKHGALYDLIHKKEIQWSMLAKYRVIRHIGLGLKSIHHLNIVHRDIKSMNILVIR